MIKLILSVFFVTAFVCNTFAQRPHPSPTPNETIRISTTLVQVDATVTDKKGKVVRNLNADDFELYENGQKQKITNFSFVESSKKSDVAQQTAGVPAATGEKLPPLPVKLKPEQVRRTIALVVDDLDLSFSSVRLVKDGLKKFVDQQMQFGDLVAIIRTGSGAGFLQQFTSDKRILYTAIDKIRWNASGSGKINMFRPADPADTAPPTAEISAALGGPGPEAQAMADDAKRAGEAFLKQQNDFQAEVFNVGSLGALNYVVDGMGKLPGRKAIVFFSEGFKLYLQDRHQAASGLKVPSPRIFEALRVLTDKANRNGVVIYPVDARGLVNGIMINAEDSFEQLDQSGGLSAMQSASLDRSTELVETQQGLRALAEETGGIAIVNNNDLNLGISRALDDQDGYYLIGYEPDEETFDPKNVRFNKITIKLNRPDLRVRYHSGFYGFNYQNNLAAAKTAREQIYGALASPLNFSEFKLQVASVFANDAENGNFIRTMIYIDGGSLTFSDEGNGWQTARYDVVALLFGEKDSVVDEVSRKQTIRASSDVLKEIKEKGFVATILVPIKKPGAYQMRVVVRDDVTSKIGSASEFVKVPKIGKDKLLISGLLLQRADDPGPGGSRPPFQTDAERDLALRTFHPGMKLRLGFGIYNAKTDNTAKSVDIAVRYRVFLDGVEVYRSEEKRIMAADQSDPRRIVAEDDFTLGKNAKPGNYILQLIVRDRLAKDGDDGVTYQFTDFDVEP